MMNTTEKTQVMLFTDLRHIRCGNLEWRSPVNDEYLHVVGPPGPQVEAYSRRLSLPAGIRIMAQEAKKDGPLEKGAPVGLGRVTYENGVYRSWYLKAEYPPGQDFGSYSHAPPVSAAICCSESNDAFQWREVSRSPVATKGRTVLEGCTVFRDDAAPPQERYKAAYLASVASESERKTLWERLLTVPPRYRDCRGVSEQHLFAVFGATSSDGLHWEDIDEAIMVHMGDTLINIYYDRALEKYVMYTRMVLHERRCVGRAETDDFRNWQGVTPMLWPGLDDPYSYDIYTNGRTTYPGLEQYHFLFPMFYHSDDESSEVRMYSSDDGICWNRVPGGPVIRPGHPGEWDGEFIYAGNGMVTLPGKRLGIAYGGTRYPHKYPRWPGVLEEARIGWACWESGRLTAVTAAEFGEFYTIPAIPSGRRLKLNARIRRGGEIRVGIEGVEGRSVSDCGAVSGDGFEIPVRWKGNPDAGIRDGEPCALHFTMRSAELFGIQWE